MPTVIDVVVSRDESYRKVDAVDEGCPHPGPLPVGEGATR